METSLAGEAGADGAYLPEPQRAAGSDLDGDDPADHPVAQADHDQADREHRAG